MKTCKYCKGSGVSPTCKEYLCIFCDGSGKKPKFPIVFSSAKPNPHYQKPGQGVSS